MRLYLKIILIVTGIFLCILIFFFFLIYNFPYNMIIQRVNYFLKKESNTSLQVEKVRYRLPNIWYIRELQLYLPGKLGEVLISEIKIKLDVLHFSKLKKIYITASDIETKGTDLLKAGLSSVDLSGSFVLDDIKKDPFNNIKDIRIAMNGGKVRLLEYSGLKITNFEVSQMTIELINKDKKFNIKNGSIISDILKGDLMGYFSRKYIDVKVKLFPSKDFFARYPDLRPILGSIINQNGLTFNLKGNIKTPKLIKE